MFRNYFKIGTRNLLRHKLYTSINVIGLAIGLASFLLINEYVKFEKSYDSFFENAGQIYRLSTVQINNGVTGTKDAMTFQPAAQAIASELPEVLLQTTTVKFEEIVLKKDSEVFRENRAISADSNFLKVFSHHVLQGDAATMLNEPNSIVLTKSKARFYFDDEDPLGKTIEVLGSFGRPFKITGVIADVPDNTHYKFDMMISDKSIVDRGDYNSWNAYNYYAFLVLDKKADLSTLQEKLDMVSKKYREDTDLHFSLFPIQDIHLKSDYTYEPEIPGNETAVSIMMVISIFILIIAWVNYINLSTARAVERAKEVGLRKVIGAFKTQIIVQFLFESFIVNLVAAALAFFIAELALGYFHQIINTTITDHIWNDPSFMKNLLVFFAIGTFVSGFYPALVLSGFRPASVLKGKFSNSRHGIVLRKGLVVLQFATSIILIAGTFIVNKQVKFMQSKDLGISIDYVIGFYMPDVEESGREEHRNKINSFKEELRNHTAIEAVGATSNIPGGDGLDINSNSGKLRIVGITEPLLGTVYVQFNDDEFLDAVNMHLAAGRDFDRTIKSDSNAVMVNEAFLRRYNINDPDSVLNEFIMFGENEENTKYNIVGIVKDFHRTSLKSAVEPTLYFPFMDASGILVKLDPDKYQDGIAFIDTKWKELFTEAPFDYTFLDDRFARLYQQDRRFSEVFMVFSILAIVIATLGLFGLSSFMAIQRTKEVGVRKVLGASIGNIIVIFYRDFLLLLGISAIIGVPVVYYSMNFWLENYAFRISFPWVLSLLSVLIVVGFALLTVGYQTFKVAILNPANTLKYE
jgi:putative ABC transport system permease protein